jgi:hypothetical protein
MKGKLQTEGVREFSKYCYGGERKEKRWTEQVTDMGEMKA